MRAGEDKILDALSRVSWELGQWHIAPHEYRAAAQSSEPSVQDILNIYPEWSDALVAAGLEPFDGWWLIQEASDAA